MSPQQGQMLLRDIVPRIASAIPVAVNAVGSEVGEFMSRAEEDPSAKATGKLDWEHLIPRGTPLGRSNRLQTKTQPEPSLCPKSIPQLPLLTMKANQHGTPVNTGDLHGNLHLAQVLDEVVGKRIVVVDDQNHKTPPPNLAQQAKIQRPKRGHAAACKAQRNAPSLSNSVLFQAYPTIYYVPGTVGWGTTFGGRPTGPWYPPPRIAIVNVGVQLNEFGFIITGTSNLVVVAEACTNCVKPLWEPVLTNTLTDGLACLGDSQWATRPARFYRLRSP